MNPTGPPNLHDLPDDDPREVRIGELINEFFDRRQRGENLTEVDFLAEHADYADDLREHLGGLDLLRGLGSSSGDATRAVGRVAGRGSSGQDAFEPSTTGMPQIPGYEILKQIGRGGMGVVFKAIQLSTKRLVALKLLLEGPLASDVSKRRFEREIALAAQLRHPNIIPIYDSGTADGRMYYAMEHVFGLPLGDYLRSHTFDISGKLRLFIKVCDPVSHAHMRGVIHRDLKPTNILVDGNGDPHVLDFGLAKAGSLIDSTTSITAQIIGTPAYMSPEQAAGDPNGIDTRVDVYALGVILYELLTGQMPYDTNVSMGKILHNIAHAEPPSPQKVNPAIDADLGAIVLKALEKQKENRYQSVDALSGDVRRYLAGEPITAKPASSMYLLKKIAWKHRAVVGISTALIFIAVAAFSVVGYFSEKLEMKAAELEQKAVEVSQSRDELERQKLEVERLAREQAEAKKAYEIARANMPPDMRRVIDTVVNASASGTGRPEEIGIKLFTEALTNQFAPAAAEPPLTKKDPVDLSAPLVSRRPEWVTPTDKETMSRDEILSEMKRLADAFMNAPPEEEATTQPAASQPAEDAPAQTNGEELTTPEPEPDSPDPAR